VQVDRWESASLEISQSVSRNMNYEAVLSFSRSNLTRKPGDPNNPGHGLDPDAFRLNSEWEDFDDRNGNGIYDPPEPIINLFPDTATYGFDFTGPAYTYGEEGLFEINQQGGVGYQSDFRFNDNGIIDNLEGEPFIDLNGNGVWDQGDFLRDKNGNGILDMDRRSTINNRNPEPYVDGDSIVGEPFKDINFNNVYDPGIDLFVMSVGDDNMDYNNNGKHDGPLDPWEPGIPYIDMNGDGIYNQPNARYDQGEPYTDWNGNGRYDYGGTSNFLNVRNYDDTAMWHYRNTDIYRLETKVFWQLGSHELKGGVSMEANEFDYREIEKPYYPYSARDDGGPYPDRGSFRHMFHYEPYRGSVYFRDKLEYGSMIASLGFRWDFFLQDRYGLVDVAEQDDLGSGVIYGDRQKFSPRIGFSYPISDKAKIHFNYGHFFQLPALEYMYRRNTSSVAQNVVIGNYNLDYQKTIQYSFGVKYAMSENYSLDVSGYFKDEFDKINSAQVRVGGLTRQQYQNSDYGRSRGFELTFEKRGGGYVNGLLSYTYAFAFGKASQTNQNYMTDFDLSREPLSEAALNNDIRHRINGNIQVFVPNTVKPRLFGLPIPNGWSLAINAVIESGRPFTPDRSFPDLSLTTGETTA
jgi:outer membrane receptor protein involved in Fe transport